MKDRRFWLYLTLSAAWMSFQTAAVAAAAGDEHNMKVGKRGEISLGTETKVGDVTLEPGRYKFQHFTNGSDHSMRLREWTEDNPYSGSGAMPRDNVAEVECRLERLNEKVRRTTARLIEEEGTRRLIRLEIAGENVAHIFQR